MPQLLQENAYPRNDLKHVGTMAIGKQDSTYEIREKKGCTTIPPSLERNLMTTTQMTNCGKRAPQKQNHALQAHPPVHSSLQGTMTRHESPPTPASCLQPFSQAASQTLRPDR